TVRGFSITLLGEGKPFVRGTVRARRRRRDLEARRSALTPRSFDEDTRDVWSGAPALFRRPVPSARGDEEEAAMDGRRGALHRRLQESGERSRGVMDLRDGPEPKG